MPVAEAQSPSSHTCSLRPRYLHCTAPCMLFSFHRGVSSPTRLSRRLAARSLSPALNATAKLTGRICRLVQPSHGVTDNSVLHMLQEQVGVRSVMHLALHRSLLGEKRTCRVLHEHVIMLLVIHILEDGLNVAQHMPGRADNRQGHSGGGARYCV